MDYKLKTERLDASRPDHIERAAAILRHGGLVAFPTETVYGLGANALDAGAVEKIFAAKQRPRWDPLIVHISDQAMLAQVAEAVFPDSSNPDTQVAAIELADLDAVQGARKGGADDAGPSSLPPSQEPANARPSTIATMMHAFWPGPLTLLLPRTRAVPDAVTARRALAGIRMPSHPVARELIRRAGVPIAAPSANRFGHTSPTSAAHVLSDLDGRIDAILDGGFTDVGLESTVLDPTQAPMVIYREGAVTCEQIELLLGPRSVVLYAPPRTVTPSESLPSPGVGLRHYAPDARLILVRVPPDHPDPRCLVTATRNAAGTGAVGVLLPQGWDAGAAAHAFPWGPWDNVEVLAHNLFAGLRALDKLGCTVIVAPVPPGRGLAAAIRDRLEKAAKT